MTFLARDLGNWLNRKKLKRASFKSDLVFLVLCLLTGDRAIRDKDGYLWFVGRADDVINSAG